MNIRHKQLIYNAICYNKKKQKKSFDVKKHIVFFVFLQVVYKVN